MFEFLGASEIVQLIEGFMHKWHEIDQQEELRHKRIIREHDETMKRLRQDLGPHIEERREQLRTRYEQEQQAAKQKVDDVERVAKTSPTVADISETTGLKPKQIMEAMKTAEDRFVHWPEPGQPGETRFALREHAEQLGLQNWQPGTGF